MFTGIVREIGRVAAIGGGPRATVLELAAPLTGPSLTVGDSLAVNGICLTVTRLSRGRVWADASPETRRVTTLARWRPSHRVHLEPSLGWGDPIGGHLVLGHVDGTGEVARIERLGQGLRMVVALDPALCRQLLPKGSIAVDGVSLTLDQGPFRDSFGCTLVPHTLRATRFGRLRPGDAVNVELDHLATAAARLSGAPSEAAGGPDGAARSGAVPLRLPTVLALGWSGARR